jgi:hypothetical protein
MFKFILTCLCLVSRTPHHHSDTRSLHLSVPHTHTTRLRHWSGVVGMDGFESVASAPWCLGQFNMCIMSNAPQFLEVQLVKPLLNLCTCSAMSPMQPRPSCSLCFVVSLVPCLTPTESRMSFCLSALPPVPTLRGPSVRGLQHCRHWAVIKPEAQFQWRRSLPSTIPTF